MSGIRNGDIVECVDDVPLHAESQIMPRRGQLYTVAAIKAVDGGHSVRLKELIPSCYRGGVCACGGCGWNATRFRKILRPKRALLASLVAGVREPA
jgi:hypothetical protein